MDRKNNTQRMVSPMISLCITTWNRSDFVINAFRSVLDDSRISEIIIMDDYSDIVIYNSLKQQIKFLNCSKIKLFRNSKNMDCYRNKHEAVKKANNDWVILLDSDNTIEKSYIDAIERMYKILGEYKNKIIYAPVFARPQFDYHSLSKMALNRKNISFIAKHYPCFSAAINTANYFFNKNEFLRVWGKYDQKEFNPHTADTIYVNYNWINEGNIIFFVPGLEYNHLVHNGSHYKNNRHKTGNLSSVLLEKFKELK